MRVYAFADEASPIIDEQIVAMKRNGLDGLEIRNVDNVNIADITEDKAKEVRGKMDAAGLSVWSIGSPIGKIDIEKDNFAVHLEKFKQTLALGNILGAKNMRIFSFYIPEGKRAEDYKNEVIDRLGILCETAAGSGITLCHENEKGIYGDIALRCAELHNALPLLKAVFDPANFVQSGQDTLTAWAMLEKYIGYMHIKDACMDGSVVPAGKGDGNIPLLLQKYIEIGGEAVTIEPHLTIFSGLSTLEREGEESKVGGYTFESDAAAFDIACKAFKECL